MISIYYLTKFLWIRNPRAACFSVSHEVAVRILAEAAGSSSKVACLQAWQVNVNCWQEVSSSTLGFPLGC